MDSSWMDVFDKKTVFALHFISYQEMKVQKHKMEHIMIYLRTIKTLTFIAIVIALNITIAAVLYSKSKIIY